MELKERKLVVIKVRKGREYEMSWNKLVWRRGWKSLCDLSVCVLLKVCCSMQREGFHLLIKLCGCGKYQTLTLLLLFEHCISCLSFYVEYISTS